MAPVTITYTSNPAPSKLMNQAIKSLKDQLPLRNLHWKPTTRTSLRTIQELNVELVELGDVPTGGRSALGSVLEQPLVNLCMVVCEVGQQWFTVLYKLTDRIPRHIRIRLNHSSEIGYLSSHLVEGQ